MIISNNPEDHGKYSQWPVGLSTVLTECPHNMTTGSPQYSTPFWKAKCEKQCPACLVIWQWENLLDIL